MLINILLCLPFCFAANYTDWKDFKIPNKLVIVVMIFSFVLQCWCNGIHGVVLWLSGLWPAYCLIPFYALKMIGAGDIKFLSALGAAMNMNCSVLLIAFSLIASAVIGMVVLIIRGTFVKRFAVLGRYLKVCLYSRTLYPYDTFATDTDESGKFEFSYGITIGMIMLAVYTYMS